MPTIKKYGCVTLRVILCIFLGVTTSYGIQNLFSTWGVREGGLLDIVFLLLSLYVMVATYNPKQVLSNFRESIDRFDNGSGLSKDNLHKL
jgi:hypothetical protein